jgi:hypothetical protein
MSPECAPGEIDQTYRWLARVHGEQPEIAVVRDHDTPHDNGSSEHNRVRLTAEAQLYRGHNILTLPAKLRRHFWVYVLVGQ